jgi:tetratricopeptide (TPR) repeat protein
VYQTGLDAVSRHYRTLSTIYGYPLQPSFVDLYFLGVWFLQREMVEKAVDVFERTVALYPGNWAGYSSLGEAYLLAGKRDKAVFNYEKAVDLNPGFIKGKKILERLRKWPYIG